MHIGRSDASPHSDETTQVFSRWMNPAGRALFVIVLASPLLVVVAAAAIVRSDFYTGVGSVVRQPVPFSHEHHVGDVGLDCRFCHYSVERAAFAGMPDTLTCMGCHSQIWSDAPLLEPVRNSLLTRTPLRWARVHDLPDYVYFSHAIHVAKGVGCQSCHGRVDRMPLVHPVLALQMQECLDCHRNPAPNLRPPSAIFDMGDVETDAASARALLDAYDIEIAPLDDCSICHR